MFNTPIIRASYAGFHQCLSMNLKRILYYAFLGTVAEYESKQMELEQANSSAVQVPYVEDQENVSDYLNVLRTAALGPLH